MNDHAIASSQASILVVESEPEINNSIRTALKDIGFENINTAPNLEKLISELQNKKLNPDWIITSLALDQKYNALNLLGIILQSQNLQHIKVSFLVNEDEDFCLPYAFQLGLFSYHEKTAPRTEITNQFKTLVKKFASDSKSGCATSAEQLRRVLLKQKNFQELIPFLESLVNHFPSHTEYLGQLAEAYVSSDQLEEAQKTIMQVKLLGPEAHQYVKDLEPIIELAKNEGKIKEIKSAEVFDVKDALIIDSDSAVVNSISDSLTTMGVKQIENFMRGDEAWERIKNGPYPDIIFTEWKIPQLSGAQIIQRIKTLKDCHSIIVITSSLVKEDNVLLVKEIGVSQVFEKPFEKQEFITRLVTTLRETKFPSDIRELEEQTYIAISQKNKESLLKIKNTLQTKPNRPDDLMDLIAAKIYYLETKYEEAKKHLLNTLHFRSKISELQIQNLLGKVLMKLGLFAEAEKCFQRAQKLSPNNIERLSLLAETQLQIGSLEKTELSLDEAKGIDANNSKIFEVESKVALTVGDQERLDNSLQNLDSLQDFVSFTNNQAVSLVKINQIPKALDLYKTAKNATTPSMKIWKPLIEYNLSLAYAKNNDYQSALKTLEKAEDYKDERLKKKALSLLERIKHAVKENRRLEFHYAPPPSTSMSDESTIDIRMKLWGADLKAGEHCCFKIFSVSNDSAQRLMLYLKNTPQVGIGNLKPTNDMEMSVQD